MAKWDLRGYDRSWGWGTVACIALVSAGISLWSVMSAERLPEELATQWNEQNIAGGFEPLFGINLLLSATAIVLCALVCGLAIAGALVPATHGGLQVEGQFPLVTWSRR